MNDAEKMKMIETAADTMRNARDLIQQAVHDINRFARQTKQGASPELCGEAGELAGLMFAANRIANDASHAADRILASAAKELL